MGEWMRLRNKGRILQRLDTKCANSLKYANPVTDASRIVGQNIPVGGWSVDPVGSTVPKGILDPSSGKIVARNAVTLRAGFC